MSDNCGCCQDPTSPTPVAIDNRPGLSSVAYRVGVYGTFRQSMLRAIARQPALQAWTTRRSDDFGIALLEMWAYLADILTFYQERIANEAYLPTATQRASVLRLARFLGYQPANGMAASAYLAYTVEKDKQVSITPRLRVQSVPEKKEDTPQKFESIESLTADWRLNQFRIFPQPQDDTPLAAGRYSAVLSGEAGKVKAGSKLVIYHPGVQSYPAQVEAKTVTALKTVDERQMLTWEPTMRNTFAITDQCSAWKYKFRLFGYNAPASYLSSSVSGGEIVWTAQTYDPFTYITSSLVLDAVYSDLKENTDLLLVAKDSSGNGRVEKLTITAVEQSVAQIPTTGVPVLQAPVSVLTLNRSLSYSINVHSAVVYELEGSALQFWTKHYAASISGNNIYTPLSTLGVESSTDPALAEIQALLTSGRSLLLEDAQENFTSAKISTLALEDDHLKITLDTSLAQPLETASAQARGNVVLSTHGETVSGEVLGSGSASEAFQTFTLKKSPVTFVPKAGATHGAASTLEVWVDQVLWGEGETLYSAAATQHAFTTQVDEEGETHLYFGDGVQGARLPTGRDNLTARYRQGIGSAGNVAAKSLKTALDKPTGLKEVTNPQAAEGGAEPETLDEARQNAPNTVRTFDRIVSLCDFEDAARAYEGIAKARADWHWDGLERAVRLTVAGDEGAIIAQGGTTHTNLVDDLNSRRDPHRKLTVIPHTPVPIQVKAKILVDGTYVTADVLSAAQAALEDYFSFDNQELGQAVHLSDIYRVLQGVAGVIYVDINQLQFKTCAASSAHGVTTNPLQAHLRLFSNEMISIENAADLEVKNI